MHQRDSIAIDEAKECENLRAPRMTRKQAYHGRYGPRSQDRGLFNTINPLTRQIRKSGVIVLRMGELDEKVGQRSQGFVSLVSTSTANTLERVSDTSRERDEKKTVRRRPRGGSKRGGVHRGKPGM